MRVGRGVVRPRRTRSETAFPIASERSSAYRFTKSKMSSSRLRVVLIDSMMPEYTIDVNCRHMMLHVPARHRLVPLCVLGSGRLAAGQYSGICRGRTVPTY